MLFMPSHSIIRTAIKLWLDHSTKLRRLSSTLQSPFWVARTILHSLTVSTRCIFQLWNATNGKPYHTFKGHATEIVCLSFDPHGRVVATGSMDNTAKMWDVETGKELHTLLVCFVEHWKLSVVSVVVFLHAERMTMKKSWNLEQRVETQGHTAEIVSLNFNTTGTTIITGSFDHTVKVWDMRTGRCVNTLAGHHGEISSTQFNYEGTICISGSIDRQCKIWDVATGKCVETLRGHNDEILDVGFNSTGSKLVTASADGTARVFNTMTASCQAILVGHEGEISKVCFNPQGSKILTASSDKTARLWDVDTGDCVRILEGHTDEIFSCAFNYEGDTIITGSKDNTCRIWKC